jgi:hypothetical protein
MNLNSVPLAVPAPLVADPIFAAIEAHRAAYGAYVAICEECVPDYTSDEKYMARARRAPDEEWEAFHAMRSTVPTTPAGIAALLTYAAEHVRERGIEIWGIDGIVGLLQTARAAVGGLNHE